MVISLEFKSDRICFQGDSGMETTDSSRCGIDAMINLRHPLAVLATWLPWSVIEASLAPKFERKDRPGHLIEGLDLGHVQSPFRRRQADAHVVDE